MEVVDCDESPQWSEEILFKLSCKELKKLARQSNVNPNFKKAELVKALLSTSGQTFSDITEKIQSKTRARVTRSRASVFQLLNKSDNVTVQELIPETYVQGSDVTDTISVNEKKVKSKRRGKSETQTNKQDPVNNKTFEIFKIVSSIQKNVHPLTEITNSDNLQSDKIELSVSTGSNNQKLKGNVKNNGQLSFSHENPHTKDDCVPDNTFKSEFNNLEKEKLNLTDNMLSSAEEKTENKTRRRGRKRKNLEENDGTVKTHKRAAAVDVKSFSDSGLTEHTKSQSPIRNRRQKNVAKGFRDSCEKSIEDKSRGQNIVDACTVKEDIDETLELKTPSLKSISSTVIGHEGDKTPSDSSSTKRKTKCESLKKNPITPDLFSEENEDFNFANEEISFKNLDKDQENTVHEPEVMPVPVRSSTFVFANDNNQSTRKRSLKATRSDLPSRRNTYTIDEIGNRETTVKHSSKGKRFERPKRSNTTFTIEEDDNRETTVKHSSKGNRFDTHKQSNTTFTIEEDAVNKKDTPAELPRQIEKSIGKRILSASIKKGTVKPPVKQNSSSSVKKTITKTAITPGSAYRNKFGVTRKLPNFKSIHQKLFNKMESLNDNEKRKQERAQLLIQSPIVPKCAVAFSSIKKEQQKDDIDSSTKKVLPSSRIQSPGLSSPSFTKASTVLPSSRIYSAGPSSPAFTKATTPAINKKPLAKTPSVNPKPLMGTKSVNRFGFRNHPKKLEAMNIVGKKLPPKSMEKSKDKERTLLQGVRMNKRFMLQMQMRQKLDC